MRTLLVTAPLKARLGEEASEGLVNMFAAYDDIATARLDLRMAEIRFETQGIRTEMANMRADLFKWMLAFWVGQFAALVGALSFMLPQR